MSVQLAALALVLAGSPAGAPPAAEGPAMAIVWRGEAKTEAEGRRLLGRYAAEAKADVSALVEVPAGFPVVVASADHPGMRPGFFPVVLGYCSAEDGGRLLGVLQQLDPEIYGRAIAGPAAPCPQVVETPDVTGPLKVRAARELVLEGTLLALTTPQSMFVTVVRDAKGRPLDRQVNLVPCHELTLEARGKRALIVRGVCSEQVDGDVCRGVEYRWIASVPATPGTRAEVRQERGKVLGTGQCAD